MPTSQSDQIMPDLPQRAPDSDSTIMLRAEIQQLTQDRDALKGRVTALEKDNVALRRELETLRENGSIMRRSSGSGGGG